MPKSYDSRTPTETQQRAAGPSHGASGARSDAYQGNPTPGAPPPRGTLGELMESARHRAELLRPQRRELERRAAEVAEPRSLAAALAGEHVAVIAEIKRASPSRGIISPALDAAAQASAYERGGAAAVSVLTEPSHFSGALADLDTVSDAVAIPVLRKDFIVAEEQILEARIAGASAVLLIARGLPQALLLGLAAFCRAAGLEPLVEVRTSEELANALSAGALLIGINARDLETLEVDRTVLPRLAALVPGDCLCIAESGLRTRADVEAVASHGVDGVLIGTALSAATEPAAAVRALTGVHRRKRAASD